MSDLMIKIDHISKQYRLGQIGGTTLRDELQRLHARVHGKEDPTRKIGAREFRKGETFLALDDYKDSYTRALNIKTDLEKEHNYILTECGEPITLGHYEQDNDAENGKEEIEWVVLAKEEDRILKSKNIHTWVDYWGEDVNHDWPWWYKQLRYLLPFLLRE